MRTLIYGLLIVAGLFVAMATCRAENVNWSGESAATVDWSGCSCSAGGPCICGVACECKGLPVSADEQVPQVHPKNNVVPLPQKSAWAEWQNGWWKHSNGSWWHETQGTRPAGFDFNAPVGACADGQCGIGVFSYSGSSGGCASGQCGTSQGFMGGQGGLFGRGKLFGGKCAGGKCGR